MEIDREKKYIRIQDLEIYKLARELSKIAWEAYSELNWQDKKIMGDQFIEATDSFGANIVEGYSRFHFLDKIKFLYNSRGSLAEARDYWLELLLERKKIKKDKYQQYAYLSDKARLKLQNFISSIYKSKNNIK
jgi:four helix bundle protein